MNDLLAFGFGFSAAATCKLLIERGFAVSGTIRDTAKAGEVRATGATPVFFGSRGDVRRALSKATHLLISTPPGETGDPVLLAYEDEIRSAPHLAWVGYLSTIGVYGNRDGAWVDETAALQPSNARNRARVEAEAAWTALCEACALRLDIFRLAGIYGPGRSPLDRVRQGTAQRVVKPGQVFNRIHVGDIARAAVAGLSNFSADRVRIFNVTDDEPAPPQDVTLYAAKLIAAPLPPEIGFEDAALQPMARSFYEDNKRVRNDKIKRELGLKLAYPTYREGLAALAAETR